MKKMKKLLCFSGCVLCVALVVMFGCSTDDYAEGASPANDSSLNVPYEYKEIGVKHNEGLEYAFQTIRKHYESQMRTKSRTEDVVLLTKEEGLALGSRAAKEFCANNVTDYSSSFYDKVVVDAAAVKTKSGESVMTPEVEAFVKKIEQLLEHEPASPGQLLTGLNKINEEAAATLPEIEAAAVYAGTSTCYNSYIYWKENFMKWVIALKYPDLLENYSDDQLNDFIFKDGELMSPVTSETKSWWDSAWSSVGETWNSISNSVSNWWDKGGGKQVVTTDAGDGVAGAMAGAMGGAVAGGVGAGPGALAGGLSGAVYGSISESIQQWLN